MNPVEFRRTTSEQARRDFHICHWASVGMVCLMALISVLDLFLSTGSSSQSPILAFLAAMLMAIAFDARRDYHELKAEGQ